MIFLVLAKRNAYFTFFQQIEEFEFFSDDDPDYVPESEDSEGDDFSNFVPVGVVEVISKCQSKQATDAESSLDASENSYESLSPVIPIPAILTGTYQTNEAPEAESSVDALEKGNDEALTPALPIPDSDKELIKGTSIPSNEKKGHKMTVKHYCLFCGNPQKRLKRHLMTKHKGEKQMIPLLNADKKKEKTELAKLRHAGDHAHNIKVLNKGEGDIVVKRRKRKQTSLDRFVPCSKCYGWFSKIDLWRHTCLHKNDDEIPNKKKVAQGMILLPRKECNDTFSEILLSMRSDVISNVCRNDETICMLGKLETGKSGHDPDRHGYIRTRMREIGRLLLELRKIPGRESDKLEDFITPQRYRDVVDATKAVSSFDQTKSNYGTPSLALKIGHSLLRICGLLKAKALENGDEILKKNVQDYETLHELTWSQQVSIHASRTLYMNKKNCSNMLPLTEDISKLSNHIRNEIELATKKMKHEKDIGHYWDRLCELTLVSVILFNRRRQGEVSKMKVEEFIKGTSNDTHNMSVVSQLCEFEKALCKTMTRIEIVGKRGRIVPVILSKETKQALDTIIEYRSHVGVCKSNIFVFARRNADSVTHIRGCDAMKKIVAEIRLQNPTSLSSTNLRKHIATMSQLANLKDNELDIVANFLGHDIRTHREYYRLPTSTIQVAKVTKLLMAMEKAPENKDVSIQDGLSTDPSQKLSEHLNTGK